MRRTAYILILALAAVACNQADKLRLEELEADYASLQGKTEAVVPASVVPREDVPGEYQFSFDQLRYGVDAGSSVSIRYSLPEASEVDVIAKEGWTASVSATSATEGIITVTAPDPASPSQVFVTARSEGGKTAAGILPLVVRDPYSDATRPLMKALGYYSFKPWNATAENFRKLVDAGLNMVTVEIDDDPWQEQIECAGQAGLRVLAVLIDKVERYYNNPDTDQSLAEAVNWLKTRPEVAAYHICDEPGVDKAPKLKMIKEKVKELDPTRPVYVNFGPEASTLWMGVPTYYEYVNLLADYLGMEQLSYDQYPVFPGRIQANWHTCLSVVADAAKRRGIEFWAFAASCWINKEAAAQTRERPNTYNLLLQIYTNLAFGAQMIQYFTIQDYGGTDFAPILRDGTWTQAYDYLKAANLEMQKRAFIFKDCDVTKVRQAGEQVSREMELSVLDLPSEIADIHTLGSVTVSFIENRGNKYIAIVNNYWSSVQPVSVTLNAPVYCIDNNADFTLLEPGVHSLEIPLGGMMVLKYE